MSTANPYYLRQADSLIWDESLQTLATQFKPNTRLPKMGSSIVRTIRARPVKSGADGRNGPSPRKTKTERSAGAEEARRR